MGKDYKAFTLAEVLITLGIIGVVAAITIPNLIYKIEHKILVSQFKKAYASAVQSFKLLQAQNEKEYACFIDKGTSMGYHSSECADFYKDWMAVQKTKNSCSYDNGKTCGVKFKGKAEVMANGGWQNNASCTYLAAGANAHTLLNGVTYYYLRSPRNFFAIDINGDKGPNKWGYDLFFVTFIKDNSLDYAPLTLGEQTCFIKEKGGYTLTEMLKEAGLK